MNVAEKTKQIPDGYHIQERHTAGGVLYYVVPDRKLYGTAREIYGEERRTIVEAIAAFNGEELKASTPKFGCLMATLPSLESIIPNWAADNIPSDTLAADGIEIETHCTVLYGFNLDFDSAKLKSLLAGSGAFELKLGKLSRFECPEYDVIKFSVISPEIRAMNKNLAKEFADDITPSQWEYNPHVTVAYVKKGTNQKLNASAIEGRTVTVQQLLYSLPEKQGRIVINLSSADVGLLATRAASILGCRNSDTAPFLAASTFEESKHPRNPAGTKGGGEFIAKKQTETPEFKAWFGNSKVVDKDGKPLAKKLVFHWTDKDSARQILDSEKWEGGSATRNFDYRFDKSGLAQSKGGSIGLVFDEKKLGQLEEIPASEWVENESEVRTEKEIPFNHPAFKGFVVRRKEDADWLMKEMDRRAIFDPENGYIPIFHPTQIKSAIGNKGTWSKTDPDITASLASRIQDLLQASEQQGHPFHGNQYVKLAEAARKQRREIQKRGEIEWLQKNHPQTLLDAELYLKPAGAKFAAFDKLLGEVSKESGSGEHKATMKSAKSLAMKVIRKNSPNYTFASPKDHVRGVIFLDDWSQVPAVAESLVKRGKWKGESSLANGYNAFGYRSLMIATTPPDGINGEIQLHTKESWALKRRTDEIYAEFRKYDGMSPNDLDPKLQREIEAGQDESRTLWNAYWAGVPEAVKAAASASVIGLESRQAPSVPVKATQAPLTNARMPFPSRIGDESKTVPSESLENEFFLSSFIDSNLRSDPESVKRINLAARAAAILQAGAPLGNRNAAGRHAVLWGVPKGKSGVLHEIPLVVTRSHPNKDPKKVIEMVKGLAGKDGFHSFRVADDGAVGSELGKPEFGKQLIAADKRDSGLILSAAVAPEDREPEARKKARDAAAAIYEAAAIAAAHKIEANKKQKRKEEIAAILLLLLLAGEDAYRKTYSVLGFDGLKNADETQIGEQAKTFAADRQDNLEEFAGKLRDAIADARANAEAQELDEADTERQVRDEAVKTAHTMIDVETTVTLGSIELDRLKRAGFKSAIWMTMEDERVRPSHVDCGNQGPVELGKPFVNGLKYPGDPNGALSEICNCRCWLVGYERAK